MKLEGDGKCKDITGSILVTDLNKKHLKKCGKANNIIRASLVIVGLCSVSTFNINRYRPLTAARNR